MTSLEERYKKAFANFEKAAAEYYPLLKQFREQNAKSGHWTHVPGLEKASQEYYKTVPEERRMDQKLREKLDRDIDKMPLPLDVRRIVKDYTGPLTEARTEAPKPRAMVDMLAQEKAEGRKGGRKTRKNRKTRRRRV